MEIPAPHKPITDTRNFTVLNPVPPFVELCLRPASISAREFAKLSHLAAAYPNDARLVEMVRKAGDASAKVPYLLEAHQTPASILSTLREVAQPHVERLQRMPEPLRATIHLLLSINEVPHGCEEYAITALLEIEQMQEEMVRVLRGLMSGRILAHEFFEENVAALQKLDGDWPRLRKEKGSQWHNYPLPDQPQIQYSPLFDAHDRLVSLRETCVIVDAPRAQMLKSFTPAVLQRPSAGLRAGARDWLCGLAYPGCGQDRAALHARPAQHYQGSPRRGEGGTGSRQLRAHCPRSPGSPPGVREENLIAFLEGQP